MPADASLCRTSYHWIMIFYRKTPAMGWTWFGP